MTRLIIVLSVCLATCGIATTQSHAQNVVCPQSQVRYEYRIRHIQRIEYTGAGWNRRRVVRTYAQRYRVAVPVTSRGHNSQGLQQPFQQLQPGCGTGVVPGVGGAAAADAKSTGPKDSLLPPVNSEIPTDAPPITDDVKSGNASPLDGQELPLTGAPTMERPGIGDSAPVEPTPVEPAPVEPAPSTPAPVTPSPVEPAPTEPAPAEVAPVKPAAEPKPASKPAPADTDSTPALKIDEKPAKVDDAAKAAKANAKPKTKKGKKAISLFDGKTLKGWKKTEFGGEGDVTVEDGVLVLDEGSDITGIHTERKLPRVNYEIEFDAQRIAGSDFFVGLTFPVKKEYCSLIMGGWGGGVCGLSSIDGYDASENPTTTYQEFKKGEWYHVRLRVTAEKIEAWLGKQKLIDQTTTNRELSIRFEVEPSRPLGFACYQTIAGLKNIKLRNNVSKPDSPPEKDE